MDAVQRVLPPPTACSDEIRVRTDWALTPPGLNVGDRFRLLFVTSTTHHARSRIINNYNLFVQGRAAAGHAAIRAYAGGFRAVGSTVFVNAQRNTCTRGAGTGVRIHWLNGSKVADDYGDFYDGSWDDRTNPRFEDGTAAPGTHVVFTGSYTNGTAHYPDALGNQRSRYGRVGAGQEGSTMNAGRRDMTDLGSYYGLSQVFRVVARPTPGAVPRATEAQFVSSPGGQSTYRAEETITVRLRMDREVTVTGRPSIGLDVGNEHRRAVYSGPAGAATMALDFSYTVHSGDFDSDGVSLCAPGRPGCGRIRLDGGSIRSLFDGTDASPVLPALAAQSGHKVDAAPLVLPSPPTACTDEIRVSPDWALTPSGLNTGDKFRLLFVTSTRRDALSGNIADYNRFVRDRAAAGHTAIRRYRGGFRVVGSTSTVDARDNTCTTGTGVRIHWLNGNKVADSYADFYDGNWDSAMQRNESGDVSDRRNVFTGSNDNGTAHSGHLGGGRLDLVRTGNPGSTRNPLSFSSASANNRLNFLGLSQVFRVGRVRATAVRVASRPAAGGIYRAGETIRIEADFSEAVAVRGTPGLVLNIRRADGTEGEYEAVFSGISFTTSGTSHDISDARLRFDFVVPEGLQDTDGISMPGSALRLNGSSVVAASGGSAVSWPLSQTNLGGKVDSSGYRPTSGGVCGRTPAVRDAIVRAVAAAADCAAVTAAHLAGGIARNYNGRMALTIEGLTSIRSGDLAGLSGLQKLVLMGRGIDTLPVGLFDGLESLEDLDVRVGLKHLPKDIFRGLDRVTVLRIEGAGVPRNRIRAGGLPDGIFEPLSRGFKETWIFDNPGYPFASLAPRTADAGPGGVLSAGQTATLGGPGNDGGLWGSNVFYDWWQHPAGTVTLQGTAALVGELRADQDNLATAPNPTFTAPVVAEETELRLSLRLDALGKSLDGSASPNFHAARSYYLRSPISNAVYTIRALAPTGLAVVSRPVSGDTYGRGETIEVAVSFGDRVLVDVSQGRPSLALSVGTETRPASYVRGSGTNRLVFAWEVGQDDADADGIAVVAGDLALGGGAITSLYGALALLAHDALAAQAGHKVDGSAAPGFALADGICARTAEVRAKLLEQVMVSDSAVANCAQVTDAHLGALTGPLDLSGAGIAVLAPGDFAGLGGISALDLSGNALAGLLPGTFDGLDATLARLDLSDNALSFLPARIFEDLTGLTALVLSGNPGSGTFVPSAVAGPAAGLDAISGGTVRLGVEGAEDGGEDPWGSNVTRAWSRPSGTGGTLTDASAARARFSAPEAGAQESHEFRLTVTGAGGSFTASDEVAVRIAAGPRVDRVSFATPPASGGGPAYAVGARIEVALGFDRAVAVDTANGAPSVRLQVGSARKSAAYLRGSGTRELVFGYEVQAADSDADGVDVVADSLRLNGATILGVSDGGAAALGHAALAGGSGRVVSGFGATLPAGGICGRSTAVQAAILARVRASEGDATLGCGAITPQQLAAISGRLDLSAQVQAHGRMTALRGGDFAWLSSVTALDLDRHALRTFPAGVFDDLTALRELSIAYNQTQAEDRMRTLPAGVFDGLTGLTVLHLGHNDLETLPAGIFAKLTRLSTLTLEGNPGSAGFLPVAMAGPEGGLQAAGGETVKLGSDAEPGGPWGGNVIHAWRQVSGPGAVLSGVDAARAGIVAPTVTAPAVLAFELTVTGRGTMRTATDRVTVQVVPRATVTSVAMASAPVDGDTYRRGEKVAVAVTFARAVTVTGTPQLALAVGSGTRRAAYARGSGTRQLVFEYVVAEGDGDSDGIAVAANALALGEGTIVDAGAMASALGHPALAAQSGHKIDGSTAGLSGGICARTPAVRDALLARVRTATSDTGLGCNAVTSAQLEALAGALELGSRGVRTLAAGDFTHLGAIAEVDLSGNDLAGLPAGAFAGLDDTLTGLDLSGNELAVLPARLFEDLTGLTALDLSGNPGSAGFRPVARAGEDREIAEGASVTLGVEAAAAGFDDPWGTNVAWSWTRTGGRDGSLADTAAARATFTAPAADGTHAFTLTVTGAGGSFTATDTATVRVGEAAVRPMPTSAEVNGATLTLTYDEDLRETNPASATGKGPVFLAVLGAGGSRRGIGTALGTVAAAAGRTVSITLAPRVQYGRQVTLSYFPDNATDGSRVRDLGGNPANEFTGFEVRNLTEPGPYVDRVAFAGAAGVYAIGDTILADVFFSEPVEVTGAPTLGLALGNASRRAAYASGSGTAALRFEYTVAEGDEDRDGITIAADTLTVPPGGTIRTVAGSRTVQLGHGAAADAARPVDGMRPTARESSTGGEVRLSTVTVTWSEALNERSVPAAPGGFTVTVNRGGSPVSGYAVNALALSTHGRALALTLSQAVRIDDAVSLVYAPPMASPLRDRAVTPNNVQEYSTGANNGTYDVPGAENVTPSAADVLVSNTGLPANRSAVQFGSASGRAVTQGFRTGPHADGYVVTAVGVDLGTNDLTGGQTLNLQMYGSDADGEPVGPPLYTLEPPAAPASAISTVGVVDFTAPAGAVLHADTPYHVAFQGTANAGWRATVELTSWDGQTGESGWTIEDKYRNHGRYTTFPDAIRIRITGRRNSLLGNQPGTGAPSIAGTAQVGETLRAGMGDIADADMLPSFTFPDGYGFQWVRVDADGESNPVPIEGANASTYTLAAEDRGKRVRVKVSFVDGLGAPEERTSDAFPASGVVTAPASGAPAITGTARVGQVLTASTSGIMDADGLTGVRYRFQWIRVDADGTSNPVPIEGATAPVYLLTSEESAKKVKVKVTFTDDDRNPEALTSSAYPSSGTVERLMRVPGGGGGDVLVSNIELVGVSGNGLGSYELAQGFETGATAYSLTTIELLLSTSLDDCGIPAVRLVTGSATASGGVTLTAPSLDMRCGDIFTFTYTAPPATVLRTGTRYFVVAEGRGNWLGVRSPDEDVAVPGWTMDNLGLRRRADSTGSFSTVRSALQMRVSGIAGTPATGAPAISGTTDAGEVLAAGIGTIEDANGLPATFPDDFGFQWIRVDADGASDPVVIDNATSSTYTLRSADIGKRVRVRVSFTDGLGIPEERTSDAFPAGGIIGYPATGAPEIAGTATVGQVLTASTSGIMDADGLTSARYRFQWIRVDGDGASNAVEIDGASEPAYVLTSSELAKKVKVRVSFTDDDGNPEELTSSAYPSSGTVEALVRVSGGGSVLVSNIETAGTTNANGISAYDHAQGFWTGGAGATLTSIQLRVQLFTCNSPPSVSLVRDSPSASGGITLSPRQSEIRCDNTPYNLTYTPPANTALQARKPYFVVAEGVGTWFSVGSGREDAAVRGWTIHDSHRFRGASSSGSFSTSDVGALRIRVYGSVSAAATGEPTISGTAEVGKVLAAGLGTIGDVNRLPASYPEDFGFQWVRVDADGRSNSVDIQNATSSAYTLAEEDAGKRVKVKVSFTDGIGTREERTSGAFPSNGTVAMPDSTAPGVVSIERQDPATSPTNADILTWRVTFSESVANVDPTDFAVSGATNLSLTVAEVAGAMPVRSQYDVMVSGGDLANLDETVTLTFAQAQNITDPAGNALASTVPTGTNEPDYIVDNSVPGVVSVERHAPASSPTNADSLTWRVTFSESVASVDPADFAVSGLTNASLAVAAAAGATPANSQYDVTAAGGDLTDLEGTVTLSFAAGQEILDKAGKALASTTPAGANVNTYEVDNTAPALATTDRATVDGASLVLSFDEALDEGVVPAADAFVVTEAGEPVGLVTQDPVAVAGVKVTLTLATMVTAGQVVTVSYTVPSDAGAARLRDSAGNAVAAIPDIQVTNETEVRAPGAPQSASGIAGDGRVRLEWSAPSSDGGAPVTGYQYRYRKETETDWPNTWNELASDARSVLVGDLDNDTLYRVQVRAVNRIGAGMSALTTATPQAASCPVPDLAGRRTEWTGTLTLGPIESNGAVVAHGFYPFIGPLLTRSSAAVTAAACRLDFAILDPRRSSG